VERVKGIEPSYAAWEAAVLPLNYTRLQQGILREFGVHNRAMLQRVLAVVLGLLFLAAVLVSAAVAAGLLLAAGLLAWTWAWWRGRTATPKRGTVIEGEYRDETHLERLSDLNRR
jgi:hypothetical protein